MKASVWKPRQGRARRETKRKSNLYLGTNAAAFAGVVVVLLFLFLVDTPDLHCWLSVGLPRAQNGAW
jgi:biopolymer transport protein ExbD